MTDTLQDVVNTVGKIHVEADKFVKEVFPDLESESKVEFYKAKIEVMNIIQKLYTSGKIEKFKIQQREYYGNNKPQPKTDSQRGRGKTAEELMELWNNADWKPTKKNPDNEYLNAEALNSIMPNLVETIRKGGMSYCDYWHWAWETDDGKVIIYRKHLSKCKKKGNPGNPVAQSTPDMELEEEKIQSDSTLNSHVEE